MKQSMTALPVKELKGFYNSLYKHFGPQGWWPGRTRFEVIVGAILTQNTNWTNVEQAIIKLRRAKLLTPQAMHKSSAKKLAPLIRSSGYFNLKAKRLKNFLDFLYRNYGGSLSRFFRLDTNVLRRELLSINGIGPETADSIALYAGGKPIFVIDAYTKRMLSRHGLVSEGASYAEMQSLFMDSLSPDEAMFNEYHALIVMLGKDFCKARNPLCVECPLQKYLN
jgi:endonuclease-3 related protein